MGFQTANGALCIPIKGPHFKGLQGVNISRRDFFCLRPLRVQKSDGPLKLKLGWLFVGGSKTSIAVL